MQRSGRLRSRSGAETTRSTTSRWCRSPQRWSLAANDRKRGYPRQAATRIFAHDYRDGRFKPVGREDGNSPVSDGLRDEGRAILVRAGQGSKQIARADLAAVRRNPSISIVPASPGSSSVSLESCILAHPPFGVLRQAQFAGNAFVVGRLRLDAEDRCDLWHDPSDGRRCSPAGSCIPECFLGALGSSIMVSTTYLGSCIGKTPANEVIIRFREYPCAGRWPSLPCRSCPQRSSRVRRPCGLCRRRPRGAAVCAASRRSLRT